MSTTATNRSVNDDTVSHTESSHPFHNGIADSDSAAVDGDEYDDEDDGSSVSRLSEADENGADSLSASLRRKRRGQQNTPGMKRRRYTCCGRCKGVALTQTQYMTSVLLITAVVLTLIIIILLYAIVPAVISNTIAGTTLSMQSVTITSPDDATNSMHLNSTMLITHTGSISAQLSSMEVSISHLLADGSGYTGTIGTVHVDPIQLSGDTIVNISSVFVITDQAAFNSLVNAILMQPTAVWHLHASVDVTPSLGPMALPTYSDLKFDKDISVTGCAGLNQTVLTNFSLAHSDVEDVIIDMTVVVTNPSSLTIDPLGTLHFNISYDNEWIGEVFTYNASLVPGNNTLRLNGTLFDSMDSSRAEQVLIELYLTGQPARVAAVAAPIASSINLFNGGMQGLTLFTSVPPNSANLVAALNFSSLSLTPSAVDTSALIEANVYVLIRNPLGDHSPLLINTMSLTSALLYQGQTVGIITSPAAPVTPIFATNNTNVTSLFLMTIAGTMQLSNQGAVYSTFANDFIRGDLLSMTVQGTTNLTALADIGNITVTDVAIVSNTTLKGLLGLNPIEHSLSIIGNHPCSSSSTTTMPTDDVCGILVNLTASLYNPSYVTVTLPSPTVYLYYHSMFIGNVTAPTLTVQAGNSTQTLYGYLYPGANQTALSQQFINDFIHARPANVTLHGTADGQVAGSAAALTSAALNLTAVVPGQDVASALIPSITMPLFVLDFHADTNLSAPITITALARAAFTLPPNLKGFLLTITYLDFYSNVLFNGTAAMGSLELAHLPVIHEHHARGADYLNLTLTAVPLVMTDNDMLGFEQFATQLLLTSSASFTMNVTADSTAETALGELLLSDITSSNPIVLAGMNRFLSPTNGASYMTVLNYDIVYTTPQYMLVQLAINVFNAANVSLFGLGELTLDLWFFGYKLGQVQVAEFTLPVGNSTQIAVANITAADTPTHAVVLRQFLSAIINGTTSNISLNGGLQVNGSIIPGITVPLLQPAVTAFTTHTPFPGVISPFIVGYNGWLNLSMINDILNDEGFMWTQMILYNPFSTYITMLNTMIEVYINGTQLHIGQWHDDLSAHPFQIPPCITVPCSTYLSPWFQVRITMGSDEVQILIDLIEKAIKGQPLLLTSIGPIIVAISHDWPDKHHNYSNAFTQFLDIDAQALPCAVTFDPTGINVTTSSEHLW